MNNERFNKLKAAAKSIGGEYAEGYKRGLNKLIHGEHYGTESEHRAWMKLDGPRVDLGDGYRDGFAGKVPRGLHGNIGNVNAQKDLPADSIIKFRINSQVKAAFVKEAESEGMTLTDWIIRNCNEKI